MNSKYLSIVFLVIFLSACKKDTPVVIPEPVPVVKSDEKEITSFKFLSSDNSNLDDNHTVLIDPSGLKLMGSLPFNTDLKALIPTIEISPKATISPSSKVAIDLESPVEFTVTAEDGTVNKYELSVTLNENEEAKIRSFSFLSAENNDGTIFGQIHEDIVGEINEEEKTIVLAIPIGTVIDELIPTMEISEFATISPDNNEALDFSQPITYTVTSQTGNEQEYEVSLTSGLKPDRQLLMELDALNPNNTLDWDFSVENLDDLPYVTATGTNLVIKLELQERNISYLPQGMEGFTFLSSLNLSSNDLAEIPDEIYNISRLRILTIRDNNISSIDKEIENLKSLSYLNLDDNQIQSLPDEITNIASLRDFFARNNNLIELPANIGNLTQLESFYVDGNQLSSLPESTSQLLNVWRMSVAQNNLSEFPNSILSLTKLKHLFLSDNNINSIPSSIGNLTLLEDLFLGGNNIQIIPLEINDLTNLKDLWLAENNIAVFPEQIDLPSLELLGLRDNPISSVSSNILELSNLRTLYLSNTNISSVPDNIDDLINLQYFSIDGNSLENIPTQIGGLTNLTYLNIGRNRLNTLPSEIGSLLNLENLIISNNPVTIIPQEICNLVSTNNVTFQKDANDVCE